VGQYLQSVIMGVIEGLTEFLPISSTGHMIIAQPLLGIDPQEPTWRVFLYVSQLGAILAVVVYFWRDLLRRVLSRPAGGWHQHLLVKLGVAMVPTVLLGLLLNDFMEAHFENPRTGPPATAAALIVGAGAILFIDRRWRTGPIENIDQVNLRQALLVGLIQCLAMWPGTSRSAATIMGGMVLGMRPRVATEFSFYLAIPTMLAAGGYRLLKYHGDLTRENAAVVGLGTAVAFGVALAVVAMFMQYVRKRRFTPFAIYRVALGLAVLAWYYTRGG